MSLSRGNKLYNGSEKTDSKDDDVSYEKKQKQKEAWIKQKFNPDSSDIQRQQLERLLKNPDKEIVIPKGLKKRTVSPPPEIVSNVPSSSAGAGSGEFHVYKAARRKEYERLRIFETEAKEEASTKEFQKLKQDHQNKDEAKTNKNRQRRLKRKKAAADAAKKEVKPSVEVGTVHHEPPLGNKDRLESSKADRKYNISQSGNTEDGSNVGTNIEKESSGQNNSGIKIVDDDEL